MRPFIAASSSAAPLKAWQRPPARHQSITAAATSAGGRQFPLDDAIRLAAARPARGRGCDDPVHPAAALHARLRRHAPARPGRAEARKHRVPVVRHYTGAPEYVELGPPAPLLRVGVAPVLVLSTLTLFGTGILLLFSPHRGGILGLHKASFIVWFAACSVHVLAYGLRTLRTLLERHFDGESVRIALVVAATLVGVAIALAT